MLLINLIIVQRNKRRQTQSWEDTFILWNYIDLLPLAIVVATANRAYGWQAAERKRLHQPPVGLVKEPPRNSGPAGCAHFRFVPRRLRAPPSSGIGRTVFDRSTATTGLSLPVVSRRDAARAWFTAHRRPFRCHRRSQSLQGRGRGRKAGKFVGREVRSRHWNRRGKDDGWVDEL